MDVRKISINTADCHCNSAEMIRILEDPITKALSLLYFASFPGTSRRARFVDMPGESATPSLLVERYSHTISARPGRGQSKIKTCQITVPGNFTTQFDGECHKCLFTGFTGIATLCFDIIRVESAKQTLGAGVLRGKGYAILIIKPSMDCVQTNGRVDCAAFLRALKHGEGG